MGLPRVEVRGKKVILLSGFEDDTKSDGAAGRTVKIEAHEELQQSAKRNPDAVAFGYVAGKWVAGA